jgi:hypothetical protein
MPLDAQILQDCLVADDYKAVETLPEKWEPLRVEITQQLAALKNMLDTESYNNDGGEAYKQCSEKLKSLTDDAGRLFTPAAENNQVRLLRAMRKIMRESGPDIPATRPMETASYALASLLPDNTLGISSPDEALSLETWKNMVKTSLEQLREAQAQSRQTDMGEWPAPLRESMAGWQSELPGIIDDMEKIVAMTLPSDPKFANPAFPFISVVARVETLKNAAATFQRLLTLPEFVVYEGVDDF